ncbi:MAG: 5-methyltetrahydropteroyltriglutamate--homocysteine methyltransferase, partial [Ilumatobacteraceae bacterium]
EFAQPRLDPTVLAPLAAKTIVLGVLDLSTQDVESPNAIADRLRSALDVLAPERLVAAPDCGMKFLPRSVAFGKLQALAEAAAMVRAEIGSASAR